MSYGIVTSMAYDEIQEMAYAANYMAAIYVLEKAGFNKEELPRFYFNDAETYYLAVQLLFTFPGLVFIDPADYDKEFQSKLANDADNACFPFPPEKADSMLNIISNTIGESICDAFYEKGFIFLVGIQAYDLPHLNPYNVAKFIIRGTRLLRRDQPQ